MWRDPVTTIGTDWNEGSELDEWTTRKKLAVGRNLVRTARPSRTGGAPHGVFNWIALIGSLTAAVASMRLRTLGRCKPRQPQQLYP